MGGTDMGSGAAGMGGGVAGSGLGSGLGPSVSASEKSEFALRAARIGESPLPPRPSLRVSYACGLRVGRTVHDSRVAPPKRPYAIPATCSTAQTALERASHYEQEQPPPCSRESEREELRQLAASQSMAGPWHTSKAGWRAR
jgi:hypothetical protein